MVLQVLVNFEGANTRPGGGKQNDIQVLVSFHILQGDGTVLASLVLQDALGRSAFLSRKDSANQKARGHSHGHTAVANFETVCLGT